ncbi:adenosylhomocysteinase [Papillibacter cinnamivorans]|uniref:Adenosylhomocysteinase n=1 Tax=Papillibacter cinnamivorans DSM 12816 TaxID=1122930 RepID=A0A1W2BVC6_9FIRM|nr:adenosylhomocysteinase [Papillibacter cinnamivorans]SMC76930.1 adenosylhomocysteinase [Papillibacter cinnamivorans DSM 12816]
MSILRDPSLAAEGRRKIEWVRSFMPVLSGIEERFIREQPFRGMRVTVSVHLEAKTANLAYVLSRGGAEVRATGSNPLSTQDDVAAGLASLGVETFAFHGASPEEYKSHLTAALGHHPELVVDDGGDLVDLLGSSCAGLGDRLVGGCEETTTGILRLKAREREGILPCAMMAVNDAKSKRYYDNKYGTGQSVWDAFMHTTNLLVAGKTVVVAGYGWCGRGIALRANGLGADVVVTEVDPFKALEAAMDSFRVMTMAEASPLGDIFITATGCRDVITAEHFRRMKDNAFLANAGHFNCEVDVRGLTEAAVSLRERRQNITGYEMPDGRTLNLLAEGRLVNLAAGNGHPAEIMDLSFAVQALSLEWLSKHEKDLSRRLYSVPEEIDGEIAGLKLQSMGMKIDSLTKEQKEYLRGWQVD